MIRLAPLPRGDAFQVLHLKAAPDQLAFIGPIEDMVREDTPGVAMHVILAGDEVVGFFKTDATYAQRHDFAQPDEPGIRGMLIGKQYQHRGYGSAAMTQMPGYLRHLFPQAETAILTVNCNNPGAIKAYVLGGWHDTGELYHGGRSGPQHIYRLRL